MRILSLFVALIFSLCFCDGYKFLMVLNSPGRSHFNVGHALAKGLVQAGHEITVVSVFPLKKPMPGYHDIYVPNVIGAMRGDLAALWQSHTETSHPKANRSLSYGFSPHTSTLCGPQFSGSVEKQSNFRCRHLRDLLQRCPLWFG
ncbi:GL12046 [Drosophila persimilis]|uniref:GL12046 n=1 Tax=Drosophila persimilis TaxID=7234 RepID=B4GLE9_DROPE|nr:GL12046 [Drosophila persimilis]